MCVWSFSARFNGSMSQLAVSGSLAASDLQHIETSSSQSAAGLWCTTLLHAEVPSSKTLNPEFPQVDSWMLGRAQVWMRLAVESNLSQTQRLQVH